MLGELISGGAEFAITAKVEPPIAVPAITRLARA
jgi:hypothetical protein